MSVITHRTLICDRCGTITESSDPVTEYAWGMMEANQVSGPVRIGSSDLCPGCMLELDRWFRVVPAK